MKGGGKEDGGGVPDATDKTTHFLMEGFAQDVDMTAVCQISYRR